MEFSANSDKLNGRKTDIVEVSVTRKNVNLLISELNVLRKRGVRKVRFRLPFDKGSAPSFIESVYSIEGAKQYALESGLEIVADGLLRDNPFLPDDENFFKTDDVQIKMDVGGRDIEPDFSVIIPAYNRQATLKFVLQRFFGQRYSKKKYEIIVVDDGSDDKTFGTIRNLGCSCAFKYLYWPRPKVTPAEAFNKWGSFYNRAGLARNIGVKYAHGRIILFNDSDILVDANCLGKHRAHHDQCANVVVRAVRRFLPGSFKASFRNVHRTAMLKRIAVLEKDKHEIGLHCREYDLKHEGWHRVVTANLSISRKLFELSGGFSRDFVFWGFEDIDLGYRLSRLGSKLVWDDKINVYHLFHAREDGKDFDSLVTLWLGMNILYRKYLDSRIYEIFRDVLMRRIEKIC